jgi:hypothetical protein
MAGDCELRRANGREATLCDEGSCVFWRAVDHIGETAGEGCAIQHYELLGDEGVAAWLQSVKDRLEQGDRQR